MSFTDAVFPDVLLEEKWGAGLDEPLVHGAPKIHSRMWGILIC